MSMVNVRNLDPDLWRRFGLEARRRGVPIGKLLTTVLREWLNQSSQAELSRAERARRGAGMFAHYSPERSAVDELLADRREEVRRELG